MNGLRNVSSRQVQQNSFIGKHWPVGTTFFVDEFLEEYSRDIEPMQGGHGDNYYYQLISYVRRLKRHVRARCTLWTENH